ncbi:hypothetical protein HMPREF0591_5629, partial [Mycobacterium parascrofulaceum ATCC BAA-614]
ERTHRSAQSRRQGRVLRGLRRTQGAARSGWQCVAAGDRPDLHYLIRNTFRLISRKYWDEIKRDVKPIYTAVNATAARSAFDELTEKWGQRYPAVIRLWDNAWNEFIPFLDYDVEIRRVICSTDEVVKVRQRQSWVCGVASARRGLRRRARPARRLRSPGRGVACCYRPHRVSGGCLVAPAPRRPIRACAVCG